ncbi:MAG TPA: methyltransferase domain-containing protein [Syntrophomonadaceae bacterium]|nr:methyltransferase domain-containing protein [Syntrophomonadaceae bacterium]
MVLKQFLDYYFKEIDSDVLKMYSDLIDEHENLSPAYVDMFSRKDEEAIDFLLKFHKATSKLREERPDQAILFNVNDNVCFPFFIKYIWGVLNDEQKAKLTSKCNTENIDEIILLLNEDVELRNWFREEIGSQISQEDMFTMNEIIALQNFSSGGELSFLNFVYPRIKEIHGNVLDAGCGAGFATLVMSQYLPVYAIDVCKTRLERAVALSEMMKKGEKQVFPQVIKLIEEELGVMHVVGNFPTAESLLAGKSKEVEFKEGSLDSIPYEDKFFGAVNCLDVLEHTFNPTKIIEQFGRVVKKGGKVFVTAPTKYGEVEQRIHESIDGSIFPAMLHMHHFDPESLNELFTKVGFTNAEMVPFDYMKWTDFIEVAERSPAKELAEELKSTPFDEVALQLFAVYEKL